MVGNALKNGNIGRADMDTKLIGVMKILYKQPAKGKGMKTETRPELMREVQN